MADTEELEIRANILRAEAVLKDGENIAHSIAKTNHDSMRALAIAQVATAKAILYLAKEVHNGSR